MARKRKPDDLWGIEQTDALMDSIFTEAKKNFGDDFYTGSEAEQLVVGLPLPALCLRYLFQSTVFPLSRMTMITGQEGSCKSALLYEIFRWHRMFGGRSVLLECEQKDSPDLRASILEYDQKACVMKECFSLEEWQEGLTWFLEHNQAMMTGNKEKPGPGRVIPFCIGIDSLMSKASSETIKKVLDQGHADRAHPLEAMKISQFMKVWPQKLSKWPFSVIGTNHLKPSQDFMGRPQHNIPGGKSLKFQETFELEMVKLGDVHRAEHDGIQLQITSRKNSLGPSRKQIKASLIWWADIKEVPVKFEEGVEVQSGLTQVQSIQRTRWNWDSASIDLLLEIQSKDRPRWKKISEVLDLQIDRGNKGNLAWSRALGISKEDKFNFSKVAQILEKRLDILNRVHAILGIRERFEFEPGKDFRDQLEVAKVHAPATMPLDEEPDLDESEIEVEPERIDE